MRNFTGSSDIFKWVKDSTG
jgi:hypothetical protein